MVNSISSCSHGYYNKNYNKMNKGFNDGSCETASGIALKNNGVETTSSIAFRANPTRMVKNVGAKSAVTSLPKKIVAFLAGALGIGVAAKASETKTLDSVKFKEVDKLTEGNAKLAEYKAKYPELAKALDGYDTYETQYNEVKIPHYSYVGKLAIFEMFEKDPQKAYILAQRLKHDKSKELTPVVLDAIINNYDELKKYPSENSLEDSYYKIGIAKQNPLVSDLATLAIKVQNYFPYIFNVVDAIDLAKYSEYCTDKESADALLEVVSKDLSRRRGEARNSAEENISYTQFYQKHPEMPDVVKDRVFKTKLTPEIESLVEKHLSSSDLNEFVDYVEKYGFDGVEELLKYHTMAPRALRVAKSHCEKVEDVKNLTKKIIMTEELFDRIEKDARTEDRVPYLAEAIKLKTLLDTSKVMLSQTPKLAEFIENMDINKKNLYQRMIEDGRCSSIQQMTELLPVYMKYPDTQITNEMINKFNDPIARAMGL
ncbi:hypothetical protein IJD34_01940 [bacterium]|nr:hypothetical protein [bacterium]